MSERGGGFNGTGDQAPVPPSKPVAECSDTETLTALAEEKAQIWALETRRLARAAHWADTHPADSIHHAAALSNTEVGGSWSEHEEPIAGPGCPLVAEFCIAELGAVLGLTTTSAKRLIGHALQLRHNLPHTWRRLRAGKIEPWRARRIAETTIHAWPPLSAEALHHIDTVVAPKAGRIGQRGLDTLVEETILRFHLHEAAANAQDGTPEEHGASGPAAPFFVDLTPGSIDGHAGMHLTGFLDLADGHELKHSLSLGAAAQATDGSTEPLQVRKAHTLGTLARGEHHRELVLNLHLHAIPLGAASVGPAPDTSLLSAATLGSSAVDDSGMNTRAPAIAGTPTAQTDLPGVDPLTRLQAGQHTVVIDQLRTWCATAGAQVKIQPVIDLAEELTSPGYTPSTRLRTQIMLRDRTCTFPYCQRPAEFTDLDHTTPYNPLLPNTPGSEQTRSTNLGCLCRTHHRLKTFGRWRVRQDRSVGGTASGAAPPGTFLWTSPHGFRFVRRPDGTTDVA